MVESDLDHRMITHYCSVEWLTTYSNLDECVPKLHSDDERILSSFTTTVDPTEGIIEAVDEEEDLVESKFEKMDE